jgi:hypothetical protein
MKIPLALLALVSLLFASNQRTAILTAQESRVMEINSEPLRIALSKIAPLEQWDVSSSQFGPRFCWTLFRPKAQQFRELWNVINNFTRQAKWHGVDNCLAPGVGMIQAPGQHLPTPPSGAETAVKRISDADITRDLAALASEIELRLGLQNVEPMSFSEALLTKEGLHKSRGPFEDFADGGQRTVYLIVKPAPEVFEATKNDIMLHFEPQRDEMTAIFVDIAGVDLAQRESGMLTDVEADKIERTFPVLWKISDYYEGAYLNANDAQALYRECNTLNQIVSSPRALRGLDKLMRIANWASTKQYGVLFSAL